MNTLDMMPVAPGGGGTTTIAHMNHRVMNTILYVVVEKVVRCNFYLRIVHPCGNKAGTSLETNSRGWGSVSAT
jgi:hypothetical protein